MNRLEHADKKRILEIVSTFLGFEIEIRGQKNVVLFLVM
jgi:hypothetical protein